MDSGSLVLHASPETSNSRINRRNPNETCAIRPLKAYQGSISGGHTSTGKADSETRQGEGDAENARIQGRHWQREDGRHDSQFYSSSNVFTKKKYSSLYSSE